MKTRNYIILGALLLVCASCYKEKPIISELGEPRHELVDSNEPARHYTYELWKNTGTIILDDYDELDYKWNVSANSPNVLTLPEKDPELYDAAITLLRSIWLDDYTEDFIRNYFPVKILLADTIRDNKYQGEIWDDQISQHGRAYIAVGRIRKDCFPVGAEDQTTAKGKLHATLWADFICKNNLIQLPQAFFIPCEDHYSESMSKNKHRDDMEYIREMGFWRYDERNLSNEWMLPDRIGDISDFIEMIVTHTAEEMSAELKGYETLTIKYNILLKAISEACGIDLQAIGNKKISK